MNLSMEAKKEKGIHLLRNKCESDLKFLCTQLLGMTDWQDPLHSELAAELAHPNPQKLILMPRGHLKSSICTVGWSIQQVLKNPNVRILITNAVWDKARDFLRQITGYLTDKSILPDIYSPFDGPRSKFTQDEITIAQRTKGTVKEATITTAGIERALTGGHYDIIIHDDLVEENNIGTKDQINKVIRFYENSLDLLDPGGKIVVIGTRWAVGDLYGHLMESQMDYINGIPVPVDQRLKWRELLKV